MSIEKTATVDSQGATEPTELVRRALAGCTESFQNLVVTYTPRLTVLLTCRHHGNRADAEDVVQEASLRALESWHRYNPAYPFRVWFYTIAFRISTDHLRKARRNSQRLMHQFQWTAATVTPPCPVEQQESVQNIWSTARSQLGEYYFSILWLSLGEELTNRQIATVLGKNVLSIRVALHRAKKQLADCLMKQSATKPTAIKYLPAAPGGD